MSAASMHQPSNNSPDSTATATRPNNTTSVAGPLRSTFELLIDAAGAVNAQPPTYTTAMPPTRAHLPPLRLAARPSPNPVPIVYSAQRLPPLQTAIHPMVQPNSLQPRPPPPPSIPQPSRQQLAMHPPNINVKPEAAGLQHQSNPVPLTSVPKKACPILPRGPTAGPAPMTLVAPSHKPPPTSVPSPASSTASLAAVAAVASASLSEVEKRQMIRKVRNREAAARSNLRRKEKHLALKHELNEAHEQEQRLRKLEESLKLENERLKKALK